MSDIGKSLNVEPPDGEATLAGREGHLRDRASDKSGEVSFVELFFDLVFVFAVTQLAAFLVENLTPEGAVRSLVLFGALWWLWINTTWATNRLDPDGAAVRLVIFALLAASLVLSASLPRAFEDRGLGVALPYVLMQVGRTLFSAWATRSEAGAQEARRFLRQAAWFAASGVLWIAGALAEADARVALWALALAIDLLSPWTGHPVPGLGRTTTRDLDVEGEHLSERCGLFIIIALGETLLVTGARVASLEWDRVTVGAAAVALAGTLVMWWIYFDTGAERGSRAVGEQRDPGRLARVAYTYLHMPIVAGIVMSAVGDKGLLEHPLDPVGWSDAATLLGGPALFLLGNFLFKNATSRRWPLSHVAGLGLLAAGLLAGEWLNVLGLSVWAVGVLAVVAALERLLLSSRAGAEQALK
jgi:low temperature requirement protein LtrA